jgi:1-acyl-sn-glycerol-3-phosphate acyltransferase
MELLNGTSGIRKAGKEFHSKKEGGDLNKRTMPESVPTIQPVIYRVSHVLGRMMMGCVASPYFLRQEALPPGPCVIVCNHISHFDPPTLIASLPEQVHVMAMKELFVHGFQWWLKAVGAFAVDRDCPRLRSTRTALKILRNGGRVLIFPEGGIRSGAESVFAGAEIKQGAAALACWAGVPVVPFVCLGTDQFYAVKWFSRHHVVVKQGKVLLPVGNLPARQARRELTLRIGGELRSMYEEVKNSPLMTEELIPQTAQERWRKMKSRLD